MSFITNIKCISTLSYYISSFKGDLVSGEIDIAVAGMTMTSEREEVLFNQIIFTVCVTNQTAIPKKSNCESNHEN